MGFLDGFDFGDAFKGGIAIGGGLMNYFGQQDAADKMGEHYDKASGLTNTQAALIKQMMDQANQQWEFYKTYNWPIQAKQAQQMMGKYLPLQSKMIDQYAKNVIPMENALYAEANKPPEVRKRMREAVGDVGRSYDAAQGQVEREMGRYGINPNSARFKSSIDDLALSKSKSIASARNLSRDAARDEAWNKKMQVMGMRKGVAVPNVADASTKAALLQSAGMGGLNSAVQNNMALGNQAFNLGQQNAYGMGSFISNLGSNPLVKGIGDSVGNWFNSDSGGGGSGFYSGGGGGADYLNGGLFDNIQGFRAQGGDVDEGLPYMVGEEGRETYVNPAGGAMPVGLGGPQVFVPPTDGYIVPNPRTVAMRRVGMTDDGVDIYGSDPEIEREKKMGQMYNTMLDAMHRMKDDPISAEVMHQVEKWRWPEEHRRPNEQIPEQFYQRDESAGIRNFLPNPYQTKDQIMMDNNHMMGNQPGMPLYNERYTGLPV
jgi:hypothetical protein